jgi:mannose-6-phosphate isomerase-like protein (cupin superfamily)
MTRIFQITSASAKGRMTTPGGEKWLAKAGKTRIAFSLAINSKACARHSHDVIEIFFVLSGDIEVLVEAGEKMQWVEVSAGDLIEIPGNAKHAFRNRSQNPVLNLLFTTSKHGRYFQEIGRPLASVESVRPPGEIQHLLKTAQRYGYWFASSEENASVGITLL